MKVSELIELLEEQDPEAEGLVMSQENWPFECVLAGVTTRDEVLRADGDDDDEGRAHRHWALHSRWHGLREGRALRDAPPWARRREGGGEAARARRSPAWGV